MAVDSGGNVYVADGSSTIHKITPGGIVDTLVGSAGQVGSNDGTGSAARFNQPQGLAVDREGNVYVADSLNSTLRKITSAGIVVTLAGRAGQVGGNDGLGNIARFSSPQGVAVDGAGNIYVTDWGENRISRGMPTGIVIRRLTTSDGFLQVRLVAPLSGSLPRSLLCAFKVSAAPQGGEHSGDGEARTEQ